MPTTTQNRAPAQAKCERARPDPIQARHVARTTILEDAWERGQDISIHSWIYRLDNGIINPLSEPISSPLANLE